MSLLDTFFCIVLGISLIYSVIRGMVQELFSLLAYVGGFVLAIRFRGEVAETLDKVIPSAAVAEVAAFGMIFLASIVGISLIGRGIKKLVRSNSGLSGLDRVMGGALGLIKGVLILVILMFPLKFFPDLQGKILSDSALAPHLHKVSEAVAETVKADDYVDKLPEFDLDGIKKKFDNLKGVGNLAQDMDTGNKDQIDDDEDVEVQGTPQDSYTSKEKRKLNDILLSLDSK